ncbi:hypothetical protein Tco_0846806 [Tanacetum coccineum]
MLSCGDRIALEVDLEPDEWIKDSGCSKHMTGNRKLFSTYKAYNGGNVIFGSNLRGEMFCEFVIQNQLFSYSLENFAQILGVPCEGACVFSDRWRVDELIYGIPTDGPYQTNLPPVEDIISSIRVEPRARVPTIGTSSVASVMRKRWISE